MASVILWLSDEYYYYAGEAGLKFFQDMFSVFLATAVIIFSCHCVHVCRWNRLVSLPDTQEPKEPQVDHREERRGPSPEGGWHQRSRRLGGLGAW